MTAAGMTRKVLRFGPSITLIRTIYNNLISLMKGTYTEATHMLILKTLSAFLLELVHRFGSLRLALQSILLFNEGQSRS